MSCNIDYVGNMLEKFTEIEEYLMNYLSGWVARKSAVCRKCQNVLVRPGEADHSYSCGMHETLAKHKPYSDSSSIILINPCTDLVNHCWVTN
jgi:hypothetical protein